MAVAAASEVPPGATININDSAGVEAAVGRCETPFSTPAAVDLALLAALHGCCAAETSE